MKQLFFLLLFFPFLHFAFGQADRNEKQLQLRWEDAVSIALSNNPQIRAAQAAQESARYALYSQRSVYFPTVSAGASASRSGTEQDNETYRTANNFSASLSAQQELFTGFRDSAKIERSKILLQIAERNLVRVEADVIYELTQAFYDVLYYQDLVRMSSDILERRTNNVRLVELRFDAGREHKGSLLRINAFAHQAEFDLAQAKRKLAVAKRNLVKVLGAFDKDMPDIDVVAEWQVAAPAVSSNQAIDETFFERLAEATPEVKIALAQVQLAKENIKLVNASWYPTFTISGSLGRNDEKFFPDRESWQIAASISMPIFTGGSRYFNSKAARQDWREAEYKFFNIMRLTKIKLEEAFVSWQDAYEKVAVQQDFQLAARVRAEIARTQYSNGLLSFQDWDLIENDLIEKEKALLASKQAAVMAEARWRNLLAEESALTYLEGK